MNFCSSIVILGNQKRCLKHCFGQSETKFIYKSGRLRLSPTGMCVRLKQKATQLNSI